MPPELQRNRAPDVFCRGRADAAGVALLVAALEAFGFPVPELTPEAIVERRRMLQMGVPPVQIHLMSAISGVEWDEVWSDRVTGTLGRHQVAFLGRETNRATDSGPRRAFRSP